MGARVVGEGRGSVYAGGQLYLEGATIPDDVEVGDHVFTDVEPVEGNVTVVPVGPVTADAESDTSVEPSADDPSRGTIDEVKARIASGEVTAEQVLEAELAKGEKARSTLVDELQASVDGT